MKSYQTLAVIGGVLGLITVFVLYAVTGSLAIFLESFGSEAPDKEQIFAQIGVSAALYVAVIIVPFAIKKAKIVGYTMFGFAIATLISAGGFGIIGAALLVASGIAAIRWKEKTSSSLSHLKDRYAKGEITKEEFDKIKKDLE